MTQTCLLVSPHFPPSTLAGVHRVRHLAKHLPHCGWVPTVVCVDETHHEERLDPELAALVPAETEVIKVGAISARWTRPLGIGEISLRAYFPMRSAIRRLLAERPFDVCLITGSPYYQMLLSREISKRFAVPVVLDFQDPWASSWGATRPILSKSGAAHRLSVLLEPRALRGASYVTTVSETQASQLRERYRWLDAARMSAHPIGADPDDFAALEGSRGGVASPFLEEGMLNLSYVGNVWPGAMETVQVLLGGVAQLLAAKPHLASRLRINFIGTSNQPNEYKRLVVKPLAEAAGVGAVVREVPQRVPFLEALSILKASDRLVMFGSLEPHYTASKIYPNLMAKRPYISLFHRDSSAREILEAAGGGVSLGFSSAEELRGLRGRITEALARLLEQPAALGVADPSAYAAYEASSIARKYGEIFDRLKVEGIRPW